MNFIDDLEKKYSSEVQTLTFHLAVLMGGADQLTNWDGTQKVGLGSTNKEKNV